MASQIDKADRAKALYIKLAGINYTLLLAKLEPYSVLGTYKITGAEGGRQAKVLYPPTYYSIRRGVDALPPYVFSNT